MVFSCRETHQRSITTNVNVRIGDNMSSHDELSDDQPNGETMPQQVHHELDLSLDNDTVAFFAIVFNRRSLAVEFDESGPFPYPMRDSKREETLVPTIIEINHGMT